MSDQITQAFGQLISPSLVEKFKNVFGDEPGQITATLDASLPTVLNGVISQATTAEGTDRMLEAVHNAHDKNVLGNIEDFFGGGGEWMHYGGSLLNNIFGSNEDHVIQKISDTTGAKKSSTHNILIITTLLVLALLGKHVADNKMDKRGFLHYLLSKVNSYGALFPAGLSAAALGLSDSDVYKSKLQGLANSYMGTTTASSMAEPGEVKKKTGILLPILLLVFLAALAWWLLRSKKTEEVVAATTVDTMAASVIKPAAIDTVARTITLPDGETFHVSKGTMEYKLVEFLNDPKRLPGKDVWFDFDDVNFDVDKATLTGESNVQIDNIADILKAYPNTKVKVGGYTDRTGNEDHNLALSQARADTVFSALKQRNVNAEQLLEAEGYGSQFATMPASASVDKRRIDRRMSLSVREK